MYGTSKEFLMQFGINDITELPNLEDFEDLVTSEYLSMQERLQKLIAEVGIASRRKAEQMIVDGLVAVNGAVVTELGTKADPEVDSIRVDGKTINAKLASRELVYVLLNKPRGYLSSTSDPDQRPLALDLLPANVRKGLHTVGRLDFNTEGLLILTNDGALTDAVTRAGRVPKVYHVKVKGHPSDEQTARLRRGVMVDGRKAVPAELQLLETTDRDNAWYRVVLTQGRNQQIRKMFDAVGHSVVKLRRVQIGVVDDAGLAVGKWRNLTPIEVKKLMSGQAPSRTAASARVGKPGGPTRRNDVRRSEGPRPRGTPSRTTKRRGV
jgi:pseudouridine synthase